MLRMGLYSSHSPGRDGPLAVVAACGCNAAPGTSSTVRTLAPAGTVNHTMITVTMTSTAVSAIDCHRKIVCVNGSTPVIGSKPGGMLAGLACNCAADDDRPI